jgi:hypothetical protein
MAAEQFRVLVSGATSSADDWFAAMDAPETDLPALNEDQKSVAQKFEISEAEYARGVLTHDLGEKRQMRRGEKLGVYISSILGTLGSGYRLVSLIYRGVDDVWIGSIETPMRTALVRIPLDLADDVLDFGNPGMIERLRNIVTHGLDGQSVSATS